MDKVLGPPGEAGIEIPVRSRSVKNAADAKLETELTVPSDLATQLVASGAGVFQEPPFQHLPLRATLMQSLDVNI